MSNHRGNVVVYFASSRWLVGTSAEANRDAFRVDDDDQTSWLSRFPGRYK